MANWQTVLCWQVIRLLKNIGYFCLEFTEKMLHNHVDKLYLGAGGVDLNAGVTEYNLEEMLVKRAMVKQAEEIILVVDAAKFGTVALAPIIPLSEVDTIVTDAKITEETQSAIEELGVKVIVV
jgi:DeoR/GlpR family transcriptional regulator of sugar metabolism